MTGWAAFKASVALVMLHILGQNQSNQKLLFFFFTITTRRNLMKID